MILRALQNHGTPMADVRRKLPANDVLFKHIIRGLDLDQLTLPKLTAHPSDGVSRIFLIGNKIGTRLECQTN